MENQKLKTNQMLKPMLVLMIVVAMTTAARSVERGAGKVAFVDGVETECEVLFEHPGAKALVVRSLANRTAQSFPLSVVHEVTVAGKTQTYSPKREMTAAEKTERERNSLWGDDVTPGQIGEYADEKWDKKPLIVWAKPGESGDAGLAENWLDEQGQPLKESPWHTEKSPVVAPDRPNPEVETNAGDGAYFDGDVLLPSGEAPYDVLLAGAWKGLYCVRHLTVERNGRYKIPYSMVGNLWVKAGGSLSTQGIGRYGGWAYRGPGVVARDTRTFLRFCNFHLDDLDNPTDFKAEFGERFGVPEDTHWAYAALISHYVWLDSGDKGSIEVIGMSGGAVDRRFFGDFSARILGSKGS